MIVGLQHPGSGLGDQIFSYIAARTKAEELGTDFYMVGKFKGEKFIHMTGMQSMPCPPCNVEPTTGKITVNNGFPLFETTRKYYDPEWNFIKDNTIVDGCILQDERYFDIEKVREWLITEPIDMPNDLCVISLRGGEYSFIPELFLPKIYWDNAIKKMLEINPNMKFEIHTDDAMLGQILFPDYKVVQSMGLNWKAVRYCRYLISSNSAFSIIPSLLNENVQFIIAPKYHARHNISDGYWSMEQNMYKKYNYLDRKGNLSDYDTCRQELKEYNNGVLA